jgi:3-deoxy-manno-octulosonate cytidylyltransferase (CMP-KDO synthetase)
LAVSTGNSFPSHAVLGVIPARLGSERLPRKPLHRIAGRPLIEWVWRRVRALDVLDRVVVATDSDEVARVCEAMGAEVAMTAADHPSGTDRVAEVAAREEYGTPGVVVNVQGDEPFVTDSQVRGAVDAVRAGWDVGTVAAPVATHAAWTDPSVVKVVRNDEGGALYFSRAPIPHVRDAEPDADDLASGPFLRHIGLYAYTPEALQRWVRLPPGRLEATERLEQLRPLAAGLRIGVAVVEATEGGIDTPEDARRAETRLRSTQDGGMNRDESE